MAVTQLELLPQKGMFLDEGKLSVELGRQLGPERAVDWHEFLQKMSADSETVKKNITKKVLNVHPTREAFQLFGVLTPEECEYLIAATEAIGYQLLHDYSSSYRSNTRRIIYYENLKNIIWDRVKDFITTTVPHSTLSSKWEAYGLNPQFRFCRYEPGQKFAPHYDGNYAISTEDRSLYTFMIYLNGGFDGGATNFLSLSADPSDRVLESLAPSAGMLLVFQHNIYHEGEELRTGVKYMMRSDVMYKLVSASSSESDTLDNRRIVEAQELLNLAEQKEAQGRFEESIALLKKAYKLAPELEHKEAFGDPSGAPSKQEQV